MKKSRIKDRSLSNDAKSSFHEERKNFLFRIVIYKKAN